jgi:hypothetical protein
MTPAEPPQMPVESTYNPLVVVCIISGVVLVFAFFLVMFFSCNLKAPPARPAPGDRQFPTNVP